MTNPEQSLFSEDSLAKALDTHERIVRAERFWYEGDPRAVGKWALRGVGEAESGPIEKDADVAHVVVLDYGRREVYFEDESLSTKG